MNFHSKRIGTLGKMTQKRLNQVYRIKRSANNSLSSKLGSLVDKSKSALINEHELIGIKTDQQIEAKPY